MIDFVLANSVNPDEMLCYAAAFHLGFQFAKVPIQGFHIIPYFRRKLRKMF